MNKPFFPEGQKGWEEGGKSAQSALMAPERWCRFG